MRIIIPALLVILFSCQSPHEQSESEKEVENQVTDPLPSWNEGNAKKTIVDFVTAVTDETGEGFVPEGDRVAVFDNDGTLWSEQPIYFQFYFALDRVRQMSAEHPEWISQQPFQAILEKNMEAIGNFGVQDLMEIVVTTHGNTTTDEFDSLVSNWIDTAVHPTSGKMFREMTFKPMTELISYLRENGFMVYIVSGGGISFMRPWTEKTYGIPPEKVIGSSVKTVFDLNNGHPVLKRLPEIEFIDDKSGKPVAINRFIGKKPIFCAGNSDGDLQMMQWTASNSYPGMMLYVHHDDSLREWAYDRNSHVGTFDAALDEARQKNWTLVSMKDDWKEIYPMAE